jgi:adenine-specific DNA-methyltransferase
LIYTRSDKSVFSKKITGQKEYPFEDSVGRYSLAQFQASGSDATRKARPNMWYPIFVLENGDLTTTKPDKFVAEIIPKEVDGEEGRWLWSKDKFEADYKRLLDFDGSTLSRKIFFDENADQNVYQVEKAWFEGFTNASGTKEVERLFGQKKMFDHPKPIELLQHLFSLHPSKDGLILDFFAGSSSAAQAVDSLNKQDGGTRRWIMVQLPEPTPEGSAARKHGYKTISQLSRKRISLYFETLSETLFDSNNLDSEAMGFRAFRLAESNFPVWRVPSGVPVSELEKHINEIAYFSAEQANAFDCLIEVLIKLGFSLNVPIKMIDSEVFETYSVGGGEFIAVVSSKKAAVLDDFATLLDLKPSRLLVMEDTYQGSDELKTNLEQECSNRQIELIKK